jgi:hypothetical protein
MTGDTEQRERRIRAAMAMRSLSYKALGEAIGYSKEMAHKVVTDQESSEKVRRAIESVLGESYWPLDQAAARRARENYERLVEDMRRTKDAIYQVAHNERALRREAESSLDPRCGRIGNIKWDKFIENAKELLHRIKRGRAERIDYFDSQRRQLEQAMNLANENYEQARREFREENDRLRGEATARIMARLEVFRATARADFAKYFPSDPVRVEQLVRDAEIVTGHPQRLQNLNSSDRDLRGEFIAAGIFA